MNIAEIIEALGGSQVVAPHCGVHQTTVDSWERNGNIPNRYWKVLIEISEGKIDSDTLLNACPSIEK